MDWEIEFHPVGDASKAGDAITVRYGTGGNYSVIVIDGGTDDSGNAIVEHIKTNYGPRTVISDAILSHPDSDHASGLRPIIDAFPVQRLWLHGLWHHAAAMLPLFADTRWTAPGLAEAIRKEYPIIDVLIKTAQQRGIQLGEPFQGTRIGPFVVLSPRMDRYQHLVPQFRKTPAANIELLKTRDIWLEPKKGLAGMFTRMLEAAVTLTSESWSHETLRDGGVTAAENESSAVLLGTFDQTRVLLTADAGTYALNWACDVAYAAGIDLRGCHLVQVPHHGSRRNVGPTVLNRLLGPALPHEQESKIAVASVPKDDAKHPRRVVLNAFKRRGAPVVRTCGKRYRYHSGTMPARSNEVAAEREPFHTSVEDYDT
jgi:beta-lactamase superfamily II metal-dependent hydrolase